MAFPSAERPLLDSSVVEGVSKESKQVKLFRLEGFAADPVKRVAIIGYDGTLLVDAPVVDNTYLRVDGLPNVPAAGITALDAGGNRIFTQCYVDKC